MIIRISEIAMKTAFGNIEMLLEAEIDEGRALSRAERRQLQVQRVLEAAKTCFAREGFQGASMQQICAEASMSPGALYRYFVSKEAIIEEICAAARRDDEEKLAEMLTKRDVIEGMVFGSMTHIRFVHETDAAALIAQFHAEATRSESVRLIYCNHMAEVRAIFLNYLGAALARGEIDPLFELETLVPALMSIIQGIANNDLPANGVALDKVETVVRTVMVSMLRPTQETA
ncbi:hypothetical protein CYK37_05735 [Mesorhizobium loti]|nr:hypothetical protein CYK37_05735 [Mesorhizobium loti]